MGNQPDNIKVLSSIDAAKIHLSHRVIDNFSLGDGYEYIRYSAEPVQELCEQSGLDFHELSAMIDHSSREAMSSPARPLGLAAWARVIMNRVKFLHNNPSHTSVCLDTDSVILSSPLNSTLIGNAIGKFKLEYPLIKEALFISPKLYFLELDNGKVISKGRGYSGKLTKYDYLQLYNDNIINVVDKRWRKNLESSTMSIKDQIIKISPSLTQRSRSCSSG